MPFTPPSPDELVEFTPPSPDELVEPDIEKPSFAPKGPPTRADLALRQIGADKSGAFDPFIPLGPDIKAETLPGQMLAAPYNLGKGLVEGLESRGGLATIPLGVGGKVAHAAIGAGFGIPAIKEGLHQIYEGAAMKDRQEVMQGALQALTGGWITAGGLKGLAKEAPKVAAPEVPPVIPPPKIAEVQPPQTAPINLEVPGDRVSTEAPPVIAQGVTPSEAPVSAAEAKAVTAAVAPQAITETTTKPTVTQTGAETPPEISGFQMGAAGLEEALPTPTALKNASGELERIGLGIHDAPETVRRSMEKAWAQSGQIEEAFPGAGADLANGLVANPEMGLTDLQSAAILRHKVDLFNRLNDAAERTHVGDEPSRASAQVEYDKLKLDYGNLLDAVKKRGSEWGREGRWRQAMAREDFTFSSVDDMNRYRRTLTGEDLPGEKVEQATKKSKEVKQAQVEADKATNAADEAIKNKVSVPPTPAMVEAEKRAFDAAAKTVREAAVRAADKETVERVNKAKTLQDVQDIQSEAARKAIAAADDVSRRAAKDLADAETKARTATNAKDRSVANVQAIAARKAVAAADQLHRRAVLEMARTQRALRDDPIKAVWSKVKDIIDKGGNDDFNDIRAKVATELGMTTDQVGRIMAQDPKIKGLTNDAWLKQQKAGVLRQNAKMWVRNIDTPLHERALAKIPRILFGLKVGFHGTVALGTHAPTVAFQPRFWSTYVRDFGKMYKMVANPAYYERQVQDLVRRENYVTARRGGLVNDPRVYEDYTNPDTAKYFGNLTGMGNRGYTVLKILRQDMFDQMYDKLPRSLQRQDGVVSALADQINHATGVVKGRAPKVTNLAFFAPRLEASRFMQVFGDPVRAARTLADWRRATDGERLFVKNQFKEKLWILGTFFSALALNQGFLSATGSKQKINGIPKELGGAGFDPLESDFLKFKVAGHDVAYGSAIVNMLKFPVRAGASLMYHGKGSKLVLEDERLSKLALDYARSQFSPFAGTLTDLGIGRDYAGRPLPRAGFGLLPGRTDIPKRLRLHGTTKPYTWAEYGSQQFTPIPISEGIREVWGDGLGMSDKQIEHYLKATAVILTMAGTGSRITEDRNIEKE